MSVLHDELRTGCQSLLPIFKCVSNEIKNERLKLIEKIIEYEKKEKENEKEKEREKNKKLYCLEIDKRNDKNFNHFGNNGDDSMQLSKTVSVLEREEKKKNTDPYSQSTYSMNSVRSHSPLVNARKGATYASTNTTSSSNSNLIENITFYDNSNYNNSINNNNDNNNDNNNENYSNNNFDKSTIRRRELTPTLNSNFHDNSNNLKNRKWQS